MNWKCANDLSELHHPTIATVVIFAGLCNNPVGKAPFFIYVAVSPWGTSRSWGYSFLPGVMYVWLWDGHTCSCCKEIRMSAIKAAFDLLEWHRMAPITQNQSQHLFQKMLNSMYQTVFQEDGEAVHMYGLSLEMDRQQFLFFFIPFLPPTPCYLGGRRLGVGGSLIWFFMDLIQTWS